MISKQELIDWINRSNASHYAIDDDGLALISGDELYYLEIGGLPHEGDWEEDVRTGSTNLSFEEWRLQCD